MGRKAETSNVTIWESDVLEALAEMPDGSVDCIVTDPPYPTISGGSNDKPGGPHSRPSGILKKNDGKVFEHNGIAPRAYLGELFRVLADPGHLYLMTNVENLFRRGLITDLAEAGFGVHNLLPWRKNTCTPNRWYMKDTEYTIFARKGAAFSINNKGERTSQSVFPHPLDWDNVRSPKAHPTEKPVNLMKTYIANSSQPGQVILDPFMGAGSTGVAALELEREFWGVEMDPAYFEIAAERLGVKEKLEDDWDLDLGDLLGAEGDDIDAFLGI